MCLKIYHKFTFSNKEAYLRAIKKIDSYIHQNITGRVFIIKFLYYGMNFNNRDDLSYDNLKTLMRNKAIICDEIIIGSWKKYNFTLKQMESELLNRDSIFGEFTVEMQ